MYKFAQDLGIKHQGSWTSAIKKGGLWAPQVHDRFSGHLPFHFLRFWKKHAETSLTLFLGTGSLLRSRYILVRSSTLSYCALSFEFLLHVCIRGEKGEADTVMPYNVSFHEKQNVRWFEPSSHIKVSSILPSWTVKSFSMNKICSILFSKYGSNNISIENKYSKNH